VRGGEGYFEGLVLRLGDVAAGTSSPGFKERIWRYMVGTMVLGTLNLSLKGAFFDENRRGARGGRSSSEYILKVIW